MKNFIILLVSFLIVGCLVGVISVFIIQGKRISHEEACFSVPKLVLIGEISIPPSFLVQGSNSNGTYESILIPIRDSEIEYFYLRHPPEWFHQNLEQKITAETYFPDDLFLIASSIHKQHFKKNMSGKVLGIEYPLDAEGHLFIYRKVTTNEHVERFHFKL